MKEHIAALKSAEPCSQRYHGRNATVEEDVEEEEGEEEKRQAELRRFQDQLKKFIAEEDYTGAAAVKESIAALMRQAELRLVQDQLKKLIAEEDYTGVAAVKEKTARSLMPSHARNATMVARKQIGLRWKPQAMIRRRLQAPL